jgi:hypothetical protein
MMRREFLEIIIKVEQQVVAEGEGGSKRKAYDARYYTTTGKEIQVCHLKKEIFI